ncbi:hypothetical protein QBK99_23085 [Corticibacterium sp. UT-5YL-CI-8]|nr:hypothetical protein [Tianweitania sp. UT-5YL-CI-8]
MGELLDRAFQLEILSDLQNLYPRQADLERAYGKQTNNKLLVNFSYLHEHGLIDLKFSRFHSGEIKLHRATITAKGLDFITDDGGLSAILGVVTVKLHEHTIRDLLIAKITSSDAPETVKKNLVEKIKSLPADLLGGLTQKALDAGLSSLPDVAGWIAEALKSPPT